MLCDFCKATTNNKRIVAGNRICEECFQKLQGLRNKEESMLAYFGDPKNMQNATLKAKEYINDIFSDFDKRKAEAKKLLEDAEKLIKIKEDIAKKEASFIVTSTHTIDGYKIKKYLGVECAEVVLGTGAFAEFTASVSDFFGVSSESYRSKLAWARQEAINRLKLIGLLKEAHAVVGVDIDIMTIGNNMIVVSANGTLVHIEEIN